MKPTRNLVWLAALLALAGVIVGLIDSGGGAWRAAAIVAAVVALTDLGLVRATAVIEVSRRVNSSLPVNVASPVTLNLRQRGGRRVDLLLTEHLPDDVEVHGLPVALTLAADQATVVEYHVVPHQRGDLSWPPVEVQIRSPWRLWTRRRRCGAESTARVYPDFAALAGYMEMVSDRHLARVGIRVAAQRGEGLEFHQLREFRRGDSLRQVDWKATARRQTLISREYQEERDQQVLFLLDGGRQMRGRDGELSQFDHALNAMLLLAYVALRQGDNVSALTFGNESRWIPPLRGVAAINSLLNSVYDLHSSTAATDYVAAAETVMARQRKRALVVLLTSLRETDYDLTPALKLLRQRHVVMLANLRDPALDEALRLVPDDFDQALLAAGAVEYQSRRRERQRTHRRYAHIVLDSRPGDLPAHVVNGYWLIKRAGAL